MKEIMIVDGYNVINAWPELMSIKDSSLEHARDKLVHVLAGYSAYNGIRTCIVFDAADAVRMRSCEWATKDLEVVYTKEGETADSYIEKMVYGLRCQGEQVYVVTSDLAEQMMVLGAGAYRISARELRQNVHEVDKLIRDGFVESFSISGRHELGNRLNQDVVSLLDKMRRGCK